MDTPVLSSDTKECPYCAETIKAKAKICRYCGKELPLEKSISEKEPNNQINWEMVLSKKHKTKKYKTKKSWYKRWWIILLFLLICLLFTIGRFNDPQTPPNTPSNTAEQEKERPVIQTKSLNCPYCGAEGRELSKQFIFDSGIPLICSRYGDKHMWVYVR